MEKKVNTAKSTKDKDVMTTAVQTELPISADSTKKETPAKKVSAKTIATKEAPAKAVTAKEAPAKAADVKETPAKAAVVKETPAKAVTAKEAPTKEDKVIEKKDVQKRTSKKTTTTKKKVTKAEPSSEIYVQYAGEEVLLSDLVEKAKQAYIAEGHRASAIKSVRVYVKPEEGMAYYVVNDKASGSIALY